MEQTITYRIEKEDKEKIKVLAKSLGLGLASFSRTLVLQKIREAENTD